MPFAPRLIEDRPMPFAPRLTRGQANAVCSPFKLENRPMPFASHLHLEDRPTPFAPRLIEDRQMPFAPRLTRRAGLRRFPLAHSEGRQKPFDPSILTGKLVCIENMAATSRR